LFGNMCEHRPARLNRIMNELRSLKLPHYRHQYPYIGNGSM